MDRDARVLCRAGTRSPALLSDGDFLWGEPDSDGNDRFVLCEINVSSVAPFPPSAIGSIVPAVRSRIAET